MQSSFESIKATRATAIVSCMKFCSDHFIKIDVRAKQICHGNCNAIENPFLKYAPTTETKHIKVYNYLTYIETIDTSGFNYEYDGSFRDTYTSPYISSLKVRTFLAILGKYYKNQFLLLNQ